MATPAMLAKQGVLHRYEPALEPGHMPERMLYCTNGFLDWFSTVLPTLKKDKGSLTPEEQVDRVLWEFVTGKPLVYNQGAKNLDPMIDGVWELKTTDVRIFGWFAARNTFIATNGALRSALVPWAKYAPYIEEAKHVRNSLHLDEPKFLPGGALKDVL
ncbi:MAG: hypothetical protein ACT6Q8_18680 [Niveispirillum sp.]|uniref:hypothetical protein n=1 Tax=Niveispirillum sp. TaxID=1917217 RepID=UPI0012E17562